MCNLCDKTLKTEKGLKLHTIHCVKKNKITKPLLPSTLIKPFTYNETLNSNNPRCNSNYDLIGSKLPLLFDDFNDLITNFKRNVPTLTQTPKGARNVFAEKLSQRIKNCIGINSPCTWFSLMKFSYECIKVPNREGKKSLTTLVKENIMFEK